MDAQVFCLRGLVYQTKTREKKRKFYGEPCKYTISILTVGSTLLWPPDIIEMNEYGVRELRARIRSARHAETSGSRPARDAATTLTETLTNAYANMSLTCGPYCCPCPTTRVVRKRQWHRRPLPPPPPNLYILFSSRTLAIKRGG